MFPNVGDTVTVWKTVMGQRYRAQGRVEQKQRYHDGSVLMRVANDWWLCQNDPENGFTLIPPVGVSCRLCGETAGPMQPVNIIINYDEDGCQDDGGCFSESHTEWRCEDQDRCRKTRRQMWALQQEIARWDDMAAHEDGRGGRIGGGF